MWGYMPVEKFARMKKILSNSNTLAALLILREQVIKPVSAGVCRPKRGRSPKSLHPLDDHYQKLRCEMLARLQTLKLAA
jgi:hypothetical protein